MKTRYYILQDLPGKRHFVRTEDGEAFLQFDNEQEACAYASWLAENFTWADYVVKQRRTYDKQGPGLGILFFENFEEVKRFPKTGLSL